MVERTIKTVHALGAEGGNWQSPTFRAENAECIIAWLRSTTAAVVYNLQLFGVDPVSGQAVLINQSANFNDAATRGFAYGKYATAGYTNNVQCPIPYEYFFVVGLGGAVTFSLGVEVITGQG
jgi:hypothetical protein